LVSIYLITPCDREHPLLVEGDWLSTDGPFASTNGIDRKIDKSSVKDE